MHAHRVVEVGGEQRSIIVMEKVAGQPLSDADLTDAEARRVVEELGAWLAELHAFPVEGLGYVDRNGVGDLASLDGWLAGLAQDATVFEDAGHSIGLEPDAIRAWVREIDETLRAVPPRITLIHNDLQAVHVMVHDGRPSGVIDYGEVAAEPTVGDFAKWDFSDGQRFPVEWLQAGYGDPGLFAPPNDRTYRALWVATGLWRMAWYHRTGFRPGIEASRDRLLGAPPR